ncbi:hypothetical protein [Cryptosporangium arvum]|uniref:hypothetical protein n=1 Tax=Cryptosporangium arvum TaxID=80871 RepID=UPI0012EDB9D6|nr:hypothetical protein [Cryptosporangium arvum]
MSDACAADQRPSQVPVDRRGADISDQTLTRRYRRLRTEIGCAGRETLVLQKLTRPSRMTSVDVHGVVHQLVGGVVGRTSTTSR